MKSIYTRITNKHTYTTTMCGKCKTKVSAQHLIRRSLIDLRPNDWPDLSKNPSCELPMSIKSLTNTELENRYKAEAKSRVCLEEAKCFVNEREDKRKIKENKEIEESIVKFIHQQFLPSSESPLNMIDDFSRICINVKDNLIDNDDIYKYY